MFLSRRNIAAALSLLLCIVVLGASAYPRPYGDDDADRKDCPGHWFSFEYQGKVTTEAFLAGPTSDIPEFHDCQRFIAPDGTYEHLYAVFATFRFDSILTSVRRAAANSPPQFVAAAEIVTQTGAYPGLEIVPGFNCLYVSSADWSTAYMVQLGVAEEKCLNVRPEVADGWPLRVRRVRITNYSEADYPPVARWHQDKVTGRMLVMMKCDDAWCEIGVDSSEYIPRTLTALQGTRENRVQHIPLWYDEQMLAVPRLPGDPESVVPGVAVKPSRVRGIVRPSYNLGDWKRPKDFTIRRRAGTIWLSDTSSHYRDKMNLRKGDNAVHLTSERPFPLMWWFWRFEAFIGDPMMPFLGKAYKVDRWKHKDIDIPPTSRWRWLSNDETVWERCPEGCCQVQTKSTTVTAGT
jgi:hypothetical protein